MKRAWITAAVLSLACCVPAFAVEGGQPPKVQTVTFEQKKAEILKTIDQRLTNLQEEKSCVQAATNHDDLQACWEKLRQTMEKNRGNMGRKGGPGGPGGQVSPQGK